MGSLHSSFQDFDTLWQRRERFVFNETTVGTATTAAPRPVAPTGGPTPPAGGGTANEDTPEDPTMGNILNKNYQNIPVSDFEFLNDNVDALRSEAAFLNKFNEIIQQLILHKDKRWAMMLLRYAHSPAAVYLQSAIDPVLRTKISDIPEIDILAENEIKNKIRRTLENPLSFTVAGVRHLNEHFDKLTEDQKFRFLELSEYAYESADTANIGSYQIFTPRLLVAIYSSPKLSEFLRNAGGRQKAIWLKIENKVDFEKAALLKQLKASRNDISEWSIPDVSRLCAIYPSLCGPENGEKERFKEMHADVAEALSGWSAKILGSTKSEAGSGNAAPLENISSAQKLVLLDIVKLIGDTPFFKTVYDKYSPIFENTADSVIKDLVENDNTKNAPDVVLAWELIEDLYERFGGRLPDEYKHKLEKLVEYGNGVRFLETIGNRPIKTLTPSEEQTLNKIHRYAEKPGGFTFPDFNKATTKDTKEADDRAIKIRELDAELKEMKLEHKDDDDYLKAAKEVHEGKNAKKLEDIEALKTEYQAAWANLEQVFRDHVDPTAANYNTIDEFVGDSLGRFNSAGADNRKKDAVIIDLLASLKGKDVIKAKHAYRDISAAAEKLNAWKTAREEIQNEYDALKDKDGKTKEVQKLNKKQLDKSIEEAAAEMYHKKTVQKNASEFYKDYKENLKDRHKKKQMHYTDLLHYWHHSFGEDNVGYAADEGDWANAGRETVKLRNDIYKVLFEGEGEVTKLVNEIATDLEGLRREPKKFADTMLSRLREQLSHQALQQCLTGLFDDRENHKFWSDLIQSEQVRSEIINATRIYFREEIFRVIDVKIKDIERQCPNIEADQFSKFWNNTREHFSVGPDHAGDIQDMYDLSQERKDGTVAAISTGHEKAQKIIEGTHRESEIQEVFGQRQRRLERFDEGLRELHHQTQPQQNEIQANLEVFLKLLKDVQDPENKDDFQQKLAKLRTEWKSTKQNILPSLSDIQARYKQGLCSDVFERFFVDALVNPGEEGLYDENDQLIPLEKQLKDKEDVVTKALNDLAKNDDAVTWEHLVKCSDQIRNALDFSDNGRLASHSKALRNHLTNDLPDQLKAIKDTKFLDTKDGETSDIEEQFERERKEVEDRIAEYKKNTEDIKNKFKGDLEGSMSDEDFETKYGYTREEIQQFFKDYDEGEKAFMGVWDAFKEPGFFKKWIETKYQNAEDFANDPGGLSKRANALDDFADWQFVKKASEGLVKFSEGFKEFLEKYDKWKTENIGVKGLWHRFEFAHKKFSMRQVWQLLEKCLEANNRRRQRRDDRNVGEIGVMTFGETSKWGKEFMRMAQSSEKERIEEFKDTYKNHKVWDIREYLYKSDDKDEIRACIELLLENASMMWEDPEFLRVLNRMQSSVVFEIPADRDKELDEGLIPKIDQAFKVIWPFNKDLIAKWEAEYKDNLKKGQKQYVEEFDRLDTNANKRAEVLTRMLQDWSSGKSEGVEPARYEGFLRAAFEQGKMNGQPDKRWYYLVMGITVRNPKTGQTILSKRVLQTLQDVISEIPHIEFFVNNVDTRKNGKCVPPDTDGASKKPWTSKDFDCWHEMLGGNSDFDILENTNLKNKTSEFFQQVIMNSGVVRSRIEKKQINRKGKVDPDDGGMFAASWSFETVQQLLTRESNLDSKTENIFLRGLLQGYDLYFRHVHDYIEKGDKEYKQSDGWIRDKERKLQEAGNRMKAQACIILTLSKNYQEAPGKPPIGWGEHEWGDTTESDPNPATYYRAQGRKMMDLAVAEAGLSSEYSDLLYAPSSDQAKNPKKEYEARRTKAVELFSKDSQLFNNANVVEKALDKYYSETGSEMKYAIGDIDMKYYTKYLANRPLNLSSEIQAANDENVAAPTRIAA